MLIIPIRINTTKQDVQTWSD